MSHEPRGSYFEPLGSSLAKPKFVGAEGSVTLPPMRPVALLFVLAACKHAPPATNLDASAASEPSAPPAPSATPPAPTASASAAPSSSAPHAKLPTTAAELPAAWLACQADADCVALPSACCGAWPSNTKSRAHVQAAMTAADAARGNCADRVCAMRVLDAACDHGRCVVR